MTDNSKSRPTPTASPTPAPPAAGHDPATCPGCERLLGVAELAEVLGESRNTLYKWSSRGYPDFPRASRLPNGRIVVRCTDVRLWIAGRAR